MTAASFRVVASPKRRCQFRKRHAQNAGRKRAIQRARTADEGHDRKSPRVMKVRGRGVTSQSKPRGIELYESETASRKSEQTETVSRRRALSISDINFRMADSREIALGLSLRQSLSL